MNHSIARAALSCLLAVACLPALSQVPTLPHPSRFDGTAYAQMVVDLRVTTTGVPLIAVPEGRLLRITDVHAVALNGLVGKCIVSLSRVKTAVDPGMTERFIVAPRSHVKLEYLSGLLINSGSTLYLLKSPLSDCDTDQFAVQVRGYWFLLP